jgi:hypothetical protein
MPIHLGYNSYGHYYQWGYHGKKYYFNYHDKRSEKNAYKKAVKQAQAAYSNGYRKKYHR